MKKLFTTMVSAFLCICSVNAQKIMPSTTPNACQQDLIDRGYGMFIHYGMNTFNQQEWSEGNDAPDVYNPTSLDCDQWARVAKEAGFRYVILTTKHHDGFCLWDSKVTDYDVASSPVKTDIVKALSDACKKYNLKLGLYYSLWDRHEPTFADDKHFDKYLDFMDKQLEELLTNYGDVCEIWFDGGWVKNAEDWNVPHIYETVKKYQPGCAVGINVAILNKKPQGPDAWSNDCSRPEDMVEGNDSLYIRYFPIDFRMYDPHIALPNDKKNYQANGNEYYLPYEQTVCISRSNSWFQKNYPVESRTVDQLEEMFYWATKNDNALVINVPPDQRGLIRENEINTLLELRNRLDIMPDKPLKKSPRLISLYAPAKATSIYDNSPDYDASKAVDGSWNTRWASAETISTLEFKLNPEEQFDRITIMEYCDGVEADGNLPTRYNNRITFYSIDIYNNGNWETVYLSTQPMGDCKVINFPRPLCAEKIRLDIKGATLPPSIYEFSVYASDKE